MPGADLVHTDYNLDNILFDEQGQVSGIVDWNQGAARGARHYALLGLRLGSSGRRLGAAASARLDVHLSTLDPTLLRRYHAHWLVRSAHLSISKGFPPDRIAVDLQAAEDYLQRFAGTE